MTNLTQLSPDEITTNSQQLQSRYDAFKARGLKLDLTRGKPSAAQLDLELRAVIPAWRQGLPCRGCKRLPQLRRPPGLTEVRRLFSGLMGAAPEQVVASNNSSLALMHDTIVYALLKGTCDSSTPWAAQCETAFLCPVPGYDRHFTICRITASG